MVYWILGIFIFYCGLFIGWALRGMFEHSWDKDDERWEAEHKLHIEAEKELCELKEPKPQRQDSVYDQMKTVFILARDNGCYDAQDWIRRTFFKRIKL